MKSNDQRRTVTPKLRFPEFKDGAGWEVRKLGELFSDRQEVGFSNLPLLSLTDKEGIIPQEISGKRDNSSADKSRYLRIAIGDIAYNTMRMWEGRSAYVGIEGLVSPAYTVCRPVGDVNSLFFSFYFKTDSLISEFRRYSQGLVKDTLNLKFDSFAKIPVAVPRIPEQTRIADCLSSLDALIAAQTQKLDALRTHKQGLMQQLFPAEGERTPRLRFKEFEGSGEWEEKPLGLISEVVRGGSPRPIDDFMTTDADGLNWLKIGDVSSEAKYITGTKEKVIPAALSKTRQVYPGDLILSNSMSFGRPYISKIKTCIHDGWIAITKINQSVLSDYLYYCISSEQCQSYFATNAAGAVVKNLNADIIKLLPVPIPAPTEQQRIADCLSSLDQLISAQSDKIAELKTFKRGLMQQLFPAPEGATE